MTANGMNEEVCIVTGASRGIGQATAAALVVEHGRRVVAVSRNAKGLERLVHDLGARGGSLEPVVLDLEQKGAIGVLVDALKGRRVEALVNNAGLLVNRPFGEWTAEDLQRVFAINASVPFLLAQALAGRETGGCARHVVNIGSMGGFQGSAKFNGLAGYSASKAALACLTECLAEETKAMGGSANCLAIGAVDTEMLRAAFPGYAAPVSAADMGAYVAHFAITAHRYYNGKVLPVAVSTP